MEITPEQYARVEPHLPIQRGNVSHQNRNVIDAILFVAENGCNWRALPKRFGDWDTICKRMNRRCAPHRLQTTYSSEAR
jgi:transposase